MEAFDTLLFTKPGDVIASVGPAPMVEGRVPRDRAGRAAAAQGDVALLRRHPDLFADDLRHQRDAGVLRAALSAGAADGAHHRQHDRVPRRPGKSHAHHRRIGPRRRNRARGGRARRHAARARLHAASEEPARRARPRGLQDQSRFAQPARLGAAFLRPAFDACPTPRCSASRPS